MIVLRRHSYLLICALMLLSSCENQPHTQHQYPAMETAAFAYFSQQCSYCHVPPLPSKHNAQAWAMVMARMMQHRAERGLPPIPQQEQIEILTYLQHYAAERT